MKSFRGRKGSAGRRGARRTRGPRGRRGARVTVDTPEEGQLLLLVFRSARNRKIIVTTNKKIAKIIRTRTHIAPETKQPQIHNFYYTEKLLEKFCLLLTLKAAGFGLLRPKFCHLKCQVHFWLPPPERSVLDQFGTLRPPRLPENRTHPCCG